MRSIAGKLTLAFLLVGLTGAILVAIIVQQRTQRAFDQFILNREQQSLVDYLLQYYERNQRWDGVSGSLVYSTRQQMLPAQGDKNFSRDWKSFVLVGPDRRVVFSPQEQMVGRLVTDGELKRALVLESGGQTAGWLLLDPGPRVWETNSAESLFLKHVNSAVLLSALVAALLALLLGSLLAYTLTRSLRELTEATVAIAHGNLGQQVRVRSKDELGELAASFNQMSVDLEQATRARRQMTADIAHDIRSPLSVLTGYAEALSDGKLAGDAEVYKILNQETRHLGRLVDDLRTLSLADAGELPLVLQNIAPEELLARAANAHRVQAEGKKVALQVQAEASLPEIQVDLERMAQVLGNLLRNALRYTPEGGKIHLSATLAGDLVCLAVSDNGAGIAAEDLPYIFERSYRGDRARNQVEGESGLGLAIARSLVEAQGGKISVESQLGEGAKFTIALLARR
jgi:two-component system, OmpR family, sensor histidine kinase BaeS